MKNNPLTPYDNPASLELTNQQHILTCQRTGIVVATISVAKQAGHIAYLRQWKDNQAFHPLFSLEFGALLNFCRSSWSNFCNMTVEQGADTAFTSKQERTLQVASLAMLYHLTNVEQSIPWLPSVPSVYASWSSLMQLGYWKANLDSQRQIFPSLRINRLNNGLDLNSVLQEFWACKKQYENHVRTATEMAILNAAAEALKAVRSDLSTKVPKSKRMLWRWFSLQLPSRYSKDLESWMWDLYDAETLDELEEFTQADIDLFERIFLAEIPLGSAISHAFLERLMAKKKKMLAKQTEFEILMPEQIAAEKAAGSIAEAEPTLASCDGNKARYMVAMAKWRLAHSNILEKAQQQFARQQQITVKPSNIPSLGFLDGEDDDTDDEEDIGIDTTTDEESDDES